MTSRAGPQKRAASTRAMVAVYMAPVNLHVEDNKKKPPRPFIEPKRLRPVARPRIRRSVGGQKRPDVSSLGCPRSNVKHPVSIWAEWPLKQDQKKVAEEGRGSR